MSGYRISVFDMNEFMTVECIKPYTGLAFRKDDLRELKWKNLSLKVVTTHSVFKLDIKTGNDLFQVKKLFYIINGGNVLWKNFYQAIKEEPPGRELIILDKEPDKL